MNATQFFRLEHALGPEAGKTYPQSQQVHHEHFDAELPQIKNYGTGSIWPANISIPCPVLDRKAKRTDLISCSSVFSSRLVISGKMKEVIENYRQAGIQYFKTSLLTPLPFTSFTI